MTHQSIKPRMNYYTHAMDLLGHLENISQGLRDGSIEESLLDLIELRASQINRCAFCIDMHAKSAKIHGVHELKLHALSAWEESPLFDARERTALAWTEAVTRLHESGISDELYSQTLEHFTETELTRLTIAISTINTWNRLGVAFRPTPGSLDKQFGLDKAVMS